MGDASDSSLKSISKILSKRKLAVKISDKYSWRGLYRPKNTFKKGLKSPRKNSYNGPKPKVVYLIKTQILSEEKQAEYEVRKRRNPHQIFMKLNLLHQVISNVH